MSLSLASSTCDGRFFTHRRDEGGMDAAALEGAEEEEEAGEAATGAEGEGVGAAGAETELCLEQQKEGKEQAEEWSA